MLLPTGADVTRLIGMALLGEGEIDDGLEMLAARRPELDRAGAVVESLRCRVESCLALARLDPTEAEESAAELGRQLDEASLLSLLHRLRTNLPTSMGSGLRLRRTVVAWDLVASTPLLMDAGDEGYVEVIHELNALIDRRLANHRGVAFKYTGDGVYAWFFDRDEALRCAVEVRDDLQHRNQRSGSTPLILRTGIATGQPVDDAGDLFGVAVVVASRLCDRAGSEQIFSSLDNMHDVGSDLPCTPLGPMELKGIADPVEVVSIGG
jgi:class 3 adenylate cyclase